MQAANAALNQEASANEVRLQTMASKLQAATSRHDKAAAQLKRNEEEAAAQMQVHLKQASDQLQQAAQQLHLHEEQRTEQAVVQEQIEAENERLHRCDWPSDLPFNGS